LHPSTLAKRLNFLLLLVLIAFYFYGLGHLPLIGPDEPRYAQVGREMFLRHDLVTPTLGGHTWFEKPALLYWLQIAAFKLFGVSEWSARLGPALCGVLTVLAIWFLARRIERSTNEVPRTFSQTAALIAASCLGLIGFSRGASFDIVITMTTTWAMSFFFLAATNVDERKENLYVIGCYFFVGLSLLAKGLVGIVIPGGVIGSYYLLRREWPNRRLWLSLLWGVPLTILVSSAWYAPVIYKHGWTFVNEFFVQHHFARYLSNKYHHPQPFYFYPAILLLLTLPWTPFLVALLVRVGRWKWRGTGITDQLVVFCFAWLLFPVLFFSFSGSKLPGYILPVLPAVLILISLRVVQIEAPSSSWPIRTTGVLWTVLGLGGFVYGWRIEHLSILCCVLSAAPFLLAGVFVLATNTRWFVQAVAASVVVGVIAVLNCGAASVVRRESTRDLLRVADAQGYSNLRVLALPGDDRSAEFYAAGRVIYGPYGEVTPVYDVPQLVNEARARHERLLAFINSDDLKFYRDRTGVEVIADNGKLALICLY